MEMSSSHGSAGIELAHSNASNHPNTVISKFNGINPKSNHQPLSSSASSDLQHTTNTANTHATVAAKSLANANGVVKNNKKQQKQLTPEEIQSLLQTKIGQLDAEQHLEQEEEKEMAKAIKSASKEIHQLITEGGAGSDAIHQKYMELFQDYKRLEKELAKLKRKYEQANKDKDSGKSELSKVTGQRQKIEALCRQLQQENKRIKEESRRLSQIEQAKREDLTSKFESTIWEIKAKMEQDNDERRRKADDTDLLKDKFSSFLEQYELRERHFQAVIKSRNLELELAEVKLDQQKHLLQQEEMKVEALKSQMASFIKTEGDLRQQLNTYVDKFKQVEDTLTKSNELFTKFRNEMQQMTKKTQKLEKEHATVQAKCDRSSRNLIEMAETVQKSQKALEASASSKQKLENLCRALQVERNNLRTRLSKYEIPDESGIEHTKDSELAEIMNNNTNNNNINNTKTSNETHNTGSNGINPHNISNGHDSNEKTGPTAGGNREKEGGGSQA